MYYHCNKLKKTLIQGYKISGPCEPFLVDFTTINTHVLKDTHTSTQPIDLKSVDKVFNNLENILLKFF